MTQSKPYIAIVEQPACANVFLVSANGARIRIAQHTLERCVGVAFGYLRAEKDSLGFYLSIRRFECGPGDALTYEYWTPILEPESEQEMERRR